MSQTELKSAKPVDQLSMLELNLLCAKLCPRSEGLVWQQLEGRAVGVSPDDNSICVFIGGGFVAEEIKFKSKLDRHVEKYSATHYAQEAFGLITEGPLAVDQFEDYPNWTVSSGSIKVRDPDLKLALAKAFVRLKYGEFVETSQLKLPEFRKAA